MRLPVYAGIVGIPQTSTGTRPDVEKRGAEYLRPCPATKLTSYYTDLLNGSYTCLDRLVLNANFAPC
jgi:hypothetical protein